MTSLAEIETHDSTADLRRIELPMVQVVGPWRQRRPTREAMLGGLFYVYGLEARLKPPIDWLQDPHESRTWRYELHTLTWLKEALARHAQAADLRMLAVARDVVLDWARTHVGAADGATGPGDAGVKREESEFAWYDMAAGLRAPYVAYVLRACLAQEMLGEEDAQLLLETVERHGAFLVQGSSYAAANNHGLFQDEGLYLLGRLLPALPAAAAWRELALTRMRTTLRATISETDGAHLEHSPAYQHAILDLATRLADNVTDLPELAGLLDRLRRTAAWQTTPRGHMVQLGDTDDFEAPAWARDTAAELHGLNPLFEAGQAYVRDGDSYLAVSAACHGPAHKHADDTGFVLIESGQVVLGDAGRWGYYEDEPDRLYARSAAAHNVLTVDGHDFSWREAEPYGSGLVAAGEGSGWYAIVVRNPLLGQHRVEHRRVFLYRPAEALFVIDEVGSDETRRYDRLFHFGPELEAERDTEGGGIALVGPGVSARLLDFGRKGRATLKRGRERPRAGWAYPGDRERREAWTLTLRTRTERATFGTALLFSDAPFAPGSLELNADLLELEVGDNHLSVRLDGRRATPSLR